MKTKILKYVFVVAIAMVAGINVFNAQKTKPLSDVALANVEALADAESSDEFTSATDCVAVWENVTCRSTITGKLYSYAEKV